MNIIVLLSFFIVVLLILLFIFIWFGIKAARRLIEYENFYADSLEDVTSVLEMLETLTEKRSFMMDDPDIQNLHRMIVILRDILIGYVNAKKEKEREKEK